MKRLQRHFTRAFLAGIVALLPIGGSVVLLFLLEQKMRPLVQPLPFYFPGLALLLVIVALYVFGVLVSSFLGRWLFRIVDRIMTSLPGLGSLYDTLKQILGYGEGERAIFRRVVLVEDEATGGAELGLVTGETPDDQGGPPRLIVFLPGAPNPTIGRMLLLPSARCRDTDIPVDQAFKALLSVGTYFEKPGD
jgi:uncharacterized membrane protein